MHEEIRARLEARRDEILRRKSETVANLIDDVPDRKGDAMDIANDEQTEATQLKIESRFAIELGEIDAALKRMAEDEYGECEKCGDEIPAKRLALAPLARLCVDCQEETEFEAKRRYKRPGLMDEME